MFSIFVAKRYFFSKQKRGFIHLITSAAMLGIGVGTMALVVVLSVFNGLEQFNRDIFQLFTSDIKVSPKQSKFFISDASVIQKIRKLDGIVSVSEIIEDNVLVRYRNAQSVCQIKGVDNYYLVSSGLKEKIIEGKAQLEQDSLSKAIVGASVQRALSLNLDDVFNPLELWYPEKQISLGLNAMNNLRTYQIGVAGVFLVEQRFDNTILLPLNIVEKLTNNLQKRTSLEIQVSSMAYTETLKKQIQTILGANFIVQTSEEQNVALFRAIKVEKLFIFIALIFIIAVAAFNIFFSLSMLVLDKQNDIKTLSAMGGTPELIYRIFFTEGILVAFIGAVIGLVLGLLMCYLQNQFGFVQLNLNTSLIEAYPVKVKISDLLIIFTSVMGIAILISHFPAQKANKN